MIMTILSFVTMNVLSPCYRLLKRPSLRVIKMVVTNVSSMSDRRTADSKDPVYEEKKAPQQQEEEWWKRCLYLNEDNLRFLLLTFVTICYMVSGAAIFQLLESDYELKTIENFKEDYALQYQKIKAHIAMGNVSMAEVDHLVSMWGNATDKGLIRDRRRWDYAGSFYFAYTIVATVGFGVSAPRTVAGRIFCIFYGVLGCSFGILFFNLFLERVITLLSYIMKANYRRKLHRRANSHGRASSWTSFSDLESWRPSVYWVIFYLLLASCVIALLASLLYMEVENWSYLNSFYFCFVAFSTIGFGDIVSAQQSNEYYGPTVNAYQFGNFMFMVFGACCLYSLFNVLSITIKQALNWTIRHFEYYVESCCGWSLFEDNSELLVAPFMTKNNNRVTSTIYRSDAERKLSKDKEIFTTHDYAAANKKKLSQIENVYNDRFEASSAGSRKANKNNLIPGQVGPLAIASSKFKVEEDF